MERPLISVQLLGGFGLQYEGREMAPLARKSVSVFAYLITNRDRPQTRDLIAGRFWSDLSEDKARKRLSNALWQIRTALRELDLGDLVEANNSTIRVSKEWAVEVDLEEFERRLDDIEREGTHGLTRGRVADTLIKLVSDYPGDLMAGHYDDWIEFDRTRIKERFADALWQLIKLHKGRSDYASALRFARQLAGHSPLAEETHREVMRLCALLGQTAAAERQFELCRRLLEDELGVEPSWETTNLIERIRSQGSTAAIPVAAMDALDTPIIGRSRERALLLSRIDDLMVGSGGFVLIEGEPGIGKSRLVEDMIDSAEWRGARVLSAGHTELSRYRPYQGLQEALDPATTGLRGEHLAEVTEPIWLDLASQIFPELSQFLTGTNNRRALRPEEEPSRMNEALARVLLAQGGLGPTLIILEDVHWSDDDSMDVLTNLGQRLARSGVLICLSYRRFEAEQANAIWSGISALEMVPSSTRVVLGALNQSDVRLLVSNELGPGSLPNRIIERLVEETNGNPLFIMEALQDPQALLLDESGPTPRQEQARFPVSVARALLQRLEALPDDVSTVMRAMAVLAEPCTSQLVAEITNLDRRRTLAGLAEAVSRGFLVEIGSGVCRFSHDQTRRAVYHSMSELEILGWHDQIFHALSVGGVQAPEQLAYHADLAELWEDAVYWHANAAASAKRLNAFGVAAEHYRQAHEASQKAGRSDDERYAELLEYESVLDILGRREDQHGLLKRLSDLTLPLDAEIELAERKAWLMGYTDRHEEAAQLAEEWARRASDAGYPNHRLLTVLGVVRYWSGDLTEAIDALRRALKTVDERASRIMIQNHLGRALVDSSEFDEGNELLGDALASAEAVGDLRNQVEALNHRSISAVFRGQHAEAVEAMERGLELTRAIGYRYGEGATLINLATLRSIQGKAGVALPLFNDAAEVFDSLDDSRLKAIAYINLGMVSHSFLGENDDAATYFGSAADYFRSTGERRREMLAVTKLSEIDWESGRRRLARRRLQSVLQQAKDQGDGKAELEIRRTTAECASSVGDSELAIEHLDRALDLVREHALEMVLPHVLAHRAVVALDAGMTDDALDFAEKAAVANKPESDFGLITAWRCGLVFRSVGRGDDAIDQFDLAFQLLESNLAGLDPEQAAVSRRLPKFASIIENFERCRVRIIDVELPSGSVPTGRPLESGDFCSVRWSMSEPDDWTEENPSLRRQMRIKRLCNEALDQGAVARVYDLAEALSVSERTIKRDLAELRRQGETPKTRRSTGER